jgi:flagellar motor protein MotB
MNDATAQVIEEEISTRRDQGGIVGENAGSSIWLVSFTDVVALMLTFFVLLYSMSSPDQERWQQKIGQAPPTMNPYDGQKMEQGVHDTININRIDYQAADNLDYVEALIKEKIGQINPNSGVSLGRSDSHVEFVISIKKAFSGNGRPTTQLINTLNRIAPVLNNMNNQITIKAVYNTSRAGQSFNTLQVIGRIFKSSGYKKPLSISMNGLGKITDRDTIKLVLETNTGRRVNR